MNAPAKGTLRLFQRPVTLSQRCRCSWGASTPQSVLVAQGGSEYCAFDYMSFLHSNRWADYVWHMLRGGQIVQRATHCTISLIRLQRSFSGYTPTWSHHDTGTPGDDPADLPLHFQHCLRGIPLLTLLFSTLLELTLAKRTNITKVVSWDGRPLLPVVDTVMGTIFSNTRQPRKISCYVEFLTMGSWQSRLSALELDWFVRYQEATDRCWSSRPWEIP